MKVTIGQPAPQWRRDRVTELSERCCLPGNKHRERAGWILPFSSLNRKTAIEPTYGFVRNQRSAVFIGGQ
jgi:hypothetical protein